jgi:hypothetical protein
MTGEQDHELHFEYSEFVRLGFCMPFNQVLKVSLLGVVVAHFQRLHPNECHSRRPALASACGQSEWSVVAWLANLDTDWRTRLTDPWDC